jgi:transcriptional regulator with XRE-family HTH domain
MGKTAVEKFVSTPEGMRDFQQERSIEEVTGLICKIMARDGVSRSQLAKRLGKSPGWVTQLLDGERNKTVRTLSDVFVALGRSLHFSDGDLCPSTFASNGLAAGLPLTVSVSWQTDFSLVGSQFLQTSPVTVARPRQ